MCEAVPTLLGTAETDMYARPLRSSTATDAASTSTLNHDQLPTMTPSSPPDQTNHLSSIYGVFLFLHITTTTIISTRHILLGLSTAIQGL